MGEHGIILYEPEMEGLQIWSNSGVKAHSLQFLYVTSLQTTFTDYFYIIQNICCWFFHSYKHGVYTLIKTMVFFHAHWWGFYTKQKEDILNYYKSNQYRSCNTRSDQGSLKPHIQFLRATAFLSTSLFSPFWLFDPWLLLLHHQLSLTTIWLLDFLFRFTLFSSESPTSLCSQ